MTGASRRVDTPEQVLEITASEKALGYYGCHILRTDQVTILVRGGVVVRCNLTTEINEQVELTIGGRERFANYEMHHGMHMTGAEVMFEEIKAHKRQEQEITDKFKREAVRNILRSSSQFWVGDHPSWSIAGAPNPLLVAVCGGRKYRDKEMVGAVLTGINTKERIAGIIHGGASGADYLAKKWATDARIPSVAFMADWSVGKAAGPIRNRRLLDCVNPDILVAFPGGPGTADMVAQARARSIRMVRVDQNASCLRDAGLQIEMTQGDTVQGVFRSGRLF